MAMNDAEHRPNITTLRDAFRMRLLRQATELPPRREAGEARACCGGSARSSRITMTTAHAATKVLDPVCGMTVDPATSKHRFDHHGETFHFCSAGCRTKFAADPAKYLDKDKAPQPELPAGTIYTCPMHPEIRQVGPGSCPICGMALEPEVASLETAPNPELADMTRRFWIGLRAGAAGGGAGDGRPSRRRRTAGSIRRCRTGSSSSSRRPWCCGPAGRSSSAAGSRC